MPTRIEGQNEFASWSDLVLLDTCAWIWLIDGHVRMGRAPCLPAIEAAARDGRLALSPISMWEVATKAAKGKLTLSLPVGEWIQQGKRRARIVDAPLTAEIAIESAALPGSFHGDPADRLVVATGRVLNAVIVTSDEKMNAYSINGFAKTWRI